MAARSLSFILPVDWWRIPLMDETKRLASIEALLDHQFPSRDEKAQLRQDLRTELRKQTKASAAVGGLVMAFYLADFDGHPVSATMTCYDISGLMHLPVEFDPKKILAGFVGDKDLDASLPPLGSAFLPEGVEFPKLTTEADKAAPIETVEAADDENTDEEKAPWDKVTDYDVLAYRRHHVSPGTDHFGDDVQKIPMLQFTYFQVVPDFGIVQTVFSTPLVEAQETWQSMFDAIIATFRCGTSPEKDSPDDDTNDSSHKE